MAENMDKNLDEMGEDELPVYTLVDEDGKEYEFAQIGQTEIDGVTYLALIPANAEDSDEDPFEYIILKGQTNEDGEVDFVTIDDDEEFDRVADKFDDMFQSEEDYDQ